MRLSYKLACVVLAAVPVVALAGCSSGDGNAPPAVTASGAATAGPPPEVPAITVDAVPTADEAGLYIAQDNGYFRQQGLNVKIVSVLGGELGMPDLQSGTAQILVGNYVSFILAQLAGQFGLTPATTRPIKLSIIANGSQMQPGNQAVYVMPGSKFRTVADLAKYHASVALNTNHNIGQVLFGSLFQEHGLDIGSIHQVYENFPTMLGDLPKGKINAAWLPEPFGTIAQEAFGAMQLADFDQGSLQDFPIGAYVGTQQWISAHPNTVGAFLRALQEGQQVADSNRAAVEQGLEKNTTPATTPLQAATMTIDSYPLVMNVPVMQRVSDAMFEFGLEGGYKAPYKIINMIQPEPGMVR